MSLSLKVSGLSELKAKLKRLSPRLAGKAARAAAKKAFRPVLESARAKAPRRNKETGATGVTRRSIRVASGIDRETGAVIVGLYVRKVRGEKRGDPSWRWHFIEKGTRMQRARPFLRPALDENAQRVVDALADELAREVDKGLKEAGL